MRPPVLALVGGFLGAGKTTLLIKAAELLRGRDMRVAIITNDQGDALVDTRLAEVLGLNAEEIAGGCFCCRFSELARAAEKLAAFSPDVIFAEPVGSCIDVAATVIRPLQRFFSDRFRAAPFTVLVDPERARELLAAEADPHLAFLYRNQIVEADQVWLSKSDLCPDSPPLPVHGRLSAQTGEGIGQWLEAILGGGPAGERQLEVDYTFYAEAEAALGWLNWHARVRLRRALTPAALAGPFLETIGEALTAAEIAIAHLKLFNQSSGGYIKASVCRNGEEPLVDGDLAAPPALRHELVLNLRARAAPESLRAIVDDATAALPGKVTVLKFEAFRPAPPRPETRS